MIYLRLFIFVNFFFFLAFLWKVFVIHDIDNIDVNSPISSIRLRIRKELEKNKYISANKDMNTGINIDNISKNQSVIKINWDEIHQIHDIHYGTLLYPGTKQMKRTLVVMIRSQISKNIHQRFLDLPIFNCSLDELESQLMNKAVDYPRSKNTHFYYEGYFHSFNTSSPIFSRNPRSGKEFDKPAAPPFIRAFFEAYRQVNEQTFTGIKERLLDDAISRNVSQPLNETDVCGLVAHWIENGLLFGDLSVQMHFGSHIFGDELFWHADAENSIFHTGLTILGSRILHSRRSKSQFSDPVELLEHHNPRSIYLSSSSFMNHAPEFPANNWVTRIVSIQARILYSTSQLTLLRELKTLNPASWESLTNIIAFVYSRSDLVIPTLSHVENILDSYNT